MKIQTKRVYDAVGKEDRVRVLVDRMWPRGMARARLQADRWLKDAAPSTPLRKWFAHDPSHWEEFKQRYFSELNAKPEVVRELVELAAEGKLTLLFAARDTRFNQAVALKAYLLLMPGLPEGAAAG